MNASCGHAGAVGLLLRIEMSTEGVSTAAMLDTGAQSTIISRSTLHDIDRHLCEAGKRLPTLELPTVCLFGKDGQGGGKELSGASPFSTEV